MLLLDRCQLVADVLNSTVAVIKGMKRTLSEIPRAKWTVQYPDVPVTVQPRYRGSASCCTLTRTARRNALRAISVPRRVRRTASTSRLQDDPRPYAERVGRDERYAKVYNIDYGRCIFCGFCVEACPKDAITHGYNFEISVYNRADLLKTKDDLLITKQKQSKNYRVALSSEDVD